MSALADLILMVISLVLSALGFAIGMYVTLKVIGKGKKFSKLFFLGIFIGIVPIAVVPLLISIFPAFSILGVLLTVIINFIIIYKSLGIGFFWTIGALILNVVISLILPLVISLIAVVLIGTLA